MRKLKDMEMHPSERVNSMKIDDRIDVTISDHGCWTFTVKEVRTKCVPDKLEGLKVSTELNELFKNKCSCRNMIWSDGSHIPLGKYCTHCGKEVCNAIRY